MKQKHTTQAVVVDAKTHATFKALCIERGLKLGAVATKLIAQYVKQK